MNRGWAQLHERARVLTRADLHSLHQTTWRALHRGHTARARSIPYTANTVHAHKRQVTALGPFQPAVNVRVSCRDVSAKATNNAKNLSNLQPELAADDTSSIASQDERRLLAKARLYDISDKSRLLHEIDIGHTRFIGTRMTDRFKHRHDLDFWKLILEANKHYRGLAGVKATWRGMMHRGSPIQLPHVYANAVDLMKVFITTAVTEDMKFLSEICDHCIKNNVYRSRLFIELVGVLLQQRPNQVLTYGNKCRAYCNGPADVLEVFQSACRSELKDALRTWCALLEFLPDFQLYHDTVPYLWQSERPAAAIMVHKHLIARKDFPKTFEVLIPYVKHLAETSETPDTLIASLNAAGISYEAQVRRMHAHEKAKVVGFSPETLNTVSGNIFGRRPGKFSDHTIARALATGSFSFNFVVESLHVFGLIEFGPLSIRQMALTSESADDLKKRFAKLDDFQIDTGSSAYARVMKRLAYSGHSALVHDLARTEIHHDEFEDRQLQRRLLKDFLRTRDRRRLNTTFAILAEGKVDDFQEQQYLANALLRAAVDLQDWHRVLQQLDTIRQRGFTVNETVVRSAIQSLVPQKHKTIDASSYEIDGLGLAIGILQQIIVGGTPIAAAKWHAVVLALGDQSRLDELEHLLRWLAAWYGRKIKRQNRIAQGDMAHAATDVIADLKQLFTPGLQYFIVSWSFTQASWQSSWTGCAISHDKYMDTPWLRGAGLLKALRDEYNVQLDVSAIDKAYYRQLKRMMADRLVEANVRSNKRVASELGITIEDYLTTWEDLWGKPMPIDERTTLEAQYSA